MNINDLSQKRREHVDSCRLNGDHSHSIIANLYSDSTHFLYELLQNAQDADATKITFTLYPDRLESSHNGRAFSFTDVEAITTIGSSTKAGEANKIGKFGAGFKSVFSITETPHIYSNLFCFKISDYIIPEAIEVFEDYDLESTVLILPFNRAQSNVTELYESIAKRLCTIGKDELLFLSNLERIDWQVGEESGFVEKRVISSDNNRLNVSIQTAANKETFELYVRNFEIESKALQCKIAFAVNEEGKYVSIGFNHPLYVFFPTVVPTNLQFLVHAPYKTTPNRETINFTDPQNKLITDNIVELYKSILIDLAEREVLAVETLQLFPLSSQHGELAQKLFAASINLFKSHQLIPTQEGGYALPEDVFTVGQNVNGVLFREAHTEKLFQKSVWLHPDFSEFKNIVIKRFLTQYVGVIEYPLEQIIKPFNEDFMRLQSDAWVASFYGECAKEPYRVNGSLGSHPFARLEDGTHIPFKALNGDVQVYLHPQTPTQFQCIHPTISVSVVAAPFFKFMGLKTPDVIDEIKEFILPELIVVPVEQFAKENYFQGISTLVQMYDDSNQSDQKRILELIKSTPCILTIHYQLARPQDIYLPTEPLKRWFAADPSVSMMDKALWDVLSSSGLGTSLPFQTRPEIQTITPHIDPAHKERLHHTPSIADRGGDDFNCVGLEGLLSVPVDKELSLIIWNFLISYLEEKKNILRGYYRWQSPTNNHEKEFDSKICALLKQTPWLYDHESVVRKPTELKAEKLSEEYGYDALSADAKIFLSLLSFKTDAIEDLEKLGYKVIPPDEAEAFEAFKQLQRQAIEEEEPLMWNPASPSITAWVGEADPDMKADIETFEPQPKKQRDLRNQTPQSLFEEEGDERQYIPIIPKSVRKSIGESSEKYVYRYLQDFCEKNKEKGYYVRWMNEKKNVGWGYDFVLMQGEKELRYIEVKGRASNTGEIEISKTQWEFAKFLFDKGEGDKYSIFIVQNAGKSYAKLIPLKNPVKMWLDGNLSMLKIELSY